MLRPVLQPIDLVILNLYAFEATVAKGSDFATWYARRARRRLPQRASVTTSPPPPFLRDALVRGSIENIDIGGPSMLRSSAKNHN